jgi:hypothetical protein
MTLDTLLAEYAGVGAWRRFVSTFPEVWPEGGLSTDDQSLARVLLAELGERAGDWLSQPAEALGGRTPLQVLNGHPQGLAAFRSVVMRFPR